MQRHLEFAQSLIAPALPLGHKGRNRSMTMDETMKNYLPAIDIMMCHLGISFDQACDELGLSRYEREYLADLQSQADQASPT